MIKERERLMDAELQDVVGGGGNAYSHLEDIKDRLTAEITMQEAAGLVGKQACVMARGYLSATYYVGTIVDVDVDDETIYLDIDGRCITCYDPGKIWLTNGIGGASAGW